MDAEIRTGGQDGRTFAESEPYWPEPVRPPKYAPNIVVIFLDDLGFAEMGCFGSEIETPNIDKLAANGLIFNNYTTGPMCAPARAAIMTGKNPHSVGVGWLTHANPGYPGFQAGEISKDAPTFPELLREVGYSTYAVGKWHNAADYNVSAASDKSSWPLRRGFYRFYGFLGAETNYHAPGQIVEGNELVPTSAYDEGYYSTDDFTDRAISMLKAHKSAAPDKPFLMYFATNAPHTPHHAKPADIVKYKGRYDAGWDTIHRERDARQKKMGVIGALGAVNTSPACPMGWGNAGNAPFRFFKRTPINGGIRVPMVAHWPARIADKGDVRGEWVHVTGVMPMLLELLGLDYRRQFNGYRTCTLNGVSFLDILLDRGAKTKRSEQYYELEGNRGYISGKWKIASLQPPGEKINLDNWLLFDIDADPTETTNLAAKHPDILKDLIERFDQDAFENYAYPLDNRTLARALTHDPHRIKDANRPYIFIRAPKACRPFRPRPSLPTAITN